MEIILILGLILISGLLSMSEIALISSRKTKLEALAKKGKKSAQQALNLSKYPDRFISTVQIGVTLISIFIGLFSGEVFSAKFAEALSKIAILQPYALGIAKFVIVVVVTYFALVLGELAPKQIGISFAEQTALVISKPMDMLSKAIYPFVWFLSKSTKAVVALLGINQLNDNRKITEEEIKEIVHEGYKDGEVQEAEHDIVVRAFNLGDRTIDSIMTHYSELVTIDLSDDVAVIREKVKENLFNTYPVVSEKLDNIQGVVFLKELFVYIDSPDFSLTKLIRPAHFIHENLSVYKTLEQFRQTRTKYGIVTDEFGSVQGIVTLQDIADVLVGEVKEAGEEPEIIKSKDDSLSVDGQCSFYSFLEYFDMEYLYEENDYNTLSGLILNILERVPNTGDSFTWMNFQFEITDMDGARIDRVLVRKI